MDLLRTALIGAAAALLLPAGGAMAGPLHDAARAGDAVLVKQLLRDGANVDEQDESGETALFAAARGGWSDAYDQLLTARADASIRDNNGLTLLHATAASGNAGLLSGLIGEDHYTATKFPDVNIHDNERGVTPLAVAAEENRANIVAYLASWGAETDIPDKAGLTALTHAGQKGHEEVITLLLRLGSACQDIDPVWKVKCDARKAELGK